MSQILNQLKRAEAERERLIAERRRIEAEADAALAAREREEFVPPPAARKPAPAPRRRLLAGLAALASVAAASVVLFLLGEDQTAQPPAPVRPAALSVPTARFELRLDHDADGFAARVRERERP